MSVPSTEPDGTTPNEVPPEPHKPPTGRPPTGHREPEPFPPYKLPIYERVRRVAATLDVMSDLYYLEGGTTNGQLVNRAIVCDLLHDELEAVVTELEEGGIE